jgi:hypothetical protein
VFVIFPLFIVCKIFMVSLILPSACPLSSRCLAKFDDPCPFLSIFGVLYILRKKNSRLSDIFLVTVFAI